MNLPNLESKNKEKSSQFDTIRALSPYTWGIVIIIFLFLILLFFGSELKKFTSNNTLDDFDTLIVRNGYHDISLPDGRTWRVSYEENILHDFTGLVRHASPIHDEKFAILSHDILITAGDFQNPELVSTYVTNHHFTWKSSTNTPPQGSINLLHTFPMNQRVNEKLQTIKTGDNVTIKGYEVYRIESWNTLGEYVGYWQDSGCNTTLVTDVIIIEPNE